MVQIAASTFEGMFIRALKVNGPIVGRLKAVGFNPERMEPAYAVEVWRQSLNVAAMEYYPTLSPADAEFQLGARMVRGYLGTIVGKVIEAALPFLSADALCMRLPRFFSSGIVGDVRPPEVTKVGPGHYQVTLFGDQGVPWFTAGAVDAVLRINKISPKVRVLEVKPTSFTVDIAWDAQAQRTK